MRNKNLRIKAWTAALTITCAFIAIPAPITHAEESVLELQAQYDQLEQQIVENQKKLDEKKQESSEQKVIVSEIESEISDLNSQITILNKKIDLLNSEIGTLSGSIQTLDREISVMDKQIAQTRENISVAKVQIDETYDKAINRLSKSYMAGTASDLELLLGAKSLADVLTWQQYIQNATQYDHEIIESLKTNIAALQDLETQLDLTIADAQAKKAEAETQKTELVDKQADVASSADDLNVKKNTANAKRNEAYALLKTMNIESKEYQELDAQMRAEEERIDAEMNARLAKIASVQQDPVPVTTEAPVDTPTTTKPESTTTAEVDAAVPYEAQDESNGFFDTSESPAEADPTTTTAATTTTQPATIAPSVSGNSPKERGLICPVQNSHAVVSGTYPYYASGGVHHGIDIVITDQGKTMGHDIVSPQSGTVITVGYGDASRGNYMEIDHGNGLVTRYYHCSALTVSLGQSVSKGQLIGKIGDTGNATGPHLHFEVLLNTTSGLIRQNPLAYISVP